MTLAAVVGVVLATVAWAVIFVAPRRGIWVRSWWCALGLVAYVLVVLAALGALGDALGRPGATDVALGVGVGGAWLIATQVGHRVLCRIVPGFIEQVRGLYAIAVGDPRRHVLAAVVAMGVAEELVFRGLVQHAVGLAPAVAAYAAVQLVTRNWALVLAAAASGTVWGVLYEWTAGLTAPLLAHLVWTATLTFLWPLRGCAPERMVPRMVSGTIRSSDRGGVRPPR